MGWWIKDIKDLAVVKENRLDSFSFIILQTFTLIGKYLNMLFLFKGIVFIDPFLGNVTEIF